MHAKPRHLLAGVAVEPCLAEGHPGPPRTGLVLVAHVSGKANATTALASQLFLASRVIYTLVYMAGVPYLRTLVFGGGVLACFLILLQLL